MKTKDVDLLQLARVTKCVEYFGNLYSRIARRFGVDRSFVCRVARGSRRSVRIEKGLIGDFERFQKELMGNKGISDSTQDTAA